MCSHMDLIDEYWEAIIKNNKEYDNTFIYGVKTTNIFCRPSCKSRVPNQLNVRIFKDAESALSERFRPCKRCKPLEFKDPEQQLVDRTIQWIEEHYNEPISLYTLSEYIHISPYHLQRVFKRKKGISPTDYIQFIRLEKAKQLLQDKNITIGKISKMIGYPNHSYFYKLFKKHVCVTPMQYRKLVNQNEKTT